MEELMLVQVVAGGAFGSRTATYAVADTDELILLDAGESSNLAGNYLAIDFAGLTLEEAYAKAATENEKAATYPSDGSHLSSFGISILVCTVDTSDLDWVLKIDR